MSRIIVCNPVNPDRKVIEQTIAAIREGKSAVIPTETQYGLAIRADKEDTAERIRRIKKRNDSLIPALFVKDTKMAEEFCILGEKAELLARRFLPGPLTMVLPPRPKQKIIPDNLASDKGFGIRISSHPFVLAIMSELSFPLTATSANISGQIPPLTIEDTYSMLGDDADIYIDCGQCHGKIPSTVVGIDTSIEIIRPGAVPENEIIQALNEEFE